MRVVRVVGMVGVRSQVRVANAKNQNGGSDIALGKLSAVHIKKTRRKTIKLLGNITLPKQIFVGDRQMVLIFLDHHREFRNIVKMIGCIDVPVRVFRALTSILAKWDAMGMLAVMDAMAKQAPMARLHSYRV